MTIAGSDSGERRKPGFDGNLRIGGRNIVRRPRQAAQRQVLYLAGTRRPSGMAFKLPAVVEEHGLKVPA